MDVPSLPTRSDEDRWIWQSFYQHSRTFSLAARLLPRSVQMPIATLYMFCRRVDTIADQRVLEVGAQEALSEVCAVRHELDQTLAGHPPAADVLWRRLAEVHETYSLDRTPLYELIEGAEWDLEGRSVDTLDDLVAYSNLVGGSVGAMMLPFLVDSDAKRGELEPAARHLGIAMQITNILRDVGEDLSELERVYLPSRWLQRHGIGLPDLNGHGLPAPYPSLLERAMQAAEARYTTSFNGVQALPFQVRIGIRAAARMYREIMNEVRALGYDNLNHRAYVPFSRKLRLVIHDDYDRRKQRLVNGHA
jgi:15-cis-phytoene synthase